MRQVLLLVLIFIFALVPRVYQLDQTSIYPDEIIWMVRSKETFFAFKQLNLNYFQKGWWNLDKSTEAIGLPLVTLTGPFLTTLGQGQSKLSLNLLSDIAAARLPIAIFNSCFCVIFYLFIKKLFNQKLALLSTLLLALDPIYIGLGRSLLQDTVLTAFTFIALSSFLLFDKYRPAFILAIFMSAFAYLTKPQGLLVFSAPLILFLKHQLTLKKLLLTLVGSFLLITILWPENWIKPSFSYLGYPFHQFNISGQGMRNYFLGEITYSPSPFYYYFHIFTRLPLFICLALLISPLFFLKKIKQSDIKIVIIFVFCFLYLLVMTISDKKLGPRYILPLWPWIYLLASWTLLKITDKFKNKLIQGVFLAIIFSSSLWSTINFFPEHSLFYNSLIGGSKNAAKYDLAGLCLGAKPAFAYVNKNYPTVRSVSYLGCGEVLAPYYFSKQLTKDFKKAELVILESSFKQLLPNDKKIIFFKSLTPITMVEEGGVTLAEIYFLSEATKTTVPDL